MGSGTYAARLCADLSISGYNDWYLPSKDELNKLYLNRGFIGGFTTGNYWSSTEVTPGGMGGDISQDAYYLDFSTGGSGSTAKSNTYLVRAIKYF
jgi:hypothetical protein